MGKGGRFGILFWDLVNTLFQGIKEGIAQKGFLGLFTGGFTAAAAGIAGALIIGYLSSFIFNPKMK